MSPQPNDDDDEVRRAAKILMEIFHCRCPHHTVYVEGSDGKKKEETGVTAPSTPQLIHEGEQNCENNIQGSPTLPSAPSCSLSKLAVKEHVTSCVGDQPRSRCCSPPLPSLSFNYVGAVEDTQKGKGKGKKVHQCRICSEIHHSGQALGGHMRKHYTGPPIKMKRNKVIANNDLKPNKVLTNIDINRPPTYYYEIGETSNSKQEEVENEINEDEMEEGEIRDSPRSKHKYHA